MPKTVLACLLWVTILARPMLAADVAKPAIEKPNIVLFFADDLGYADLHCFGGQTMVTPNLDQMAREGRRLTSFYASQGVCSASRSSLMTGCYNVRVGILGALGPGAKVCLNPEEQTIAEVLKQRGYHTAIYGKWHLGDRGVGLPIHHGFDEYFGLPYSNDMWPYHPTSKNYPPLPLIENDRAINSNVTGADQRNLTKWCTEHALTFMRKHQSEPFFVYMPFNMPHVPLYASEKFEGSTGKGLFHDVIAEIDWSVGQVRQFLREANLEKNTLVLFTSDNGPWLSYGDHAGSAGPLREGKGTAWEGGVREPTIACWPGQIPANTTSNQLAGTIDVLPTLAYLSGAKLPERKIDGVNIWSLLAGDVNEPSPREAYYYYWGRELHAVRSGAWKLHFPHEYRSLANEPGKGGKPGPYKQAQCQLELYNLEDDIGESKNVIDQHADIVEKLKAIAVRARSELGDALNQTNGTEVRAAGKLE